MKTIILFGLRRSGNHFIISTILQQFKNSVHINDSYLSYNEYIKYKDIDIKDKSINRIYTGFKNADCIIISIENKDIDYIELEKFNNISDIYSIILIRNPYNNLSSAWKVYNGNLDKINELINLWQIYANTFINDTKLIKILYDKFATDDNYIHNILEKLNITKIYIDKKIYIQYQKSSFSNPLRKGKCYGYLKDCVFKNNKKFLILFNNTKIEDQWNNILIKYNN